MKKFKLETPCILDSLKTHKKIKETLLSLIKEAKSDYEEAKDDYYGDVIHRLDWNASSDNTREWDKFLRPHLEKYFKECALKLGYQDVRIVELWFQQYNKNGKHGWHTHAENYTGVYYVKFSNKDAKTELIDPFSQNKKIIINAKEGDIVIFPSYVIHRATEQKEDSEKIIVSFNINFTKILPSLFSKIDNMVGKNI
tara:strand:+ start:100 stop:690 length:591 start_codon:yes stop_codon:yes gene_type:complete